MGPDETVAIPNTTRCAARVAGDRAPGGCPAVHCTYGATRRSSPLPCGSTAGPTPTRTLAAASTAPPLSIATPRPAEPAAVAASAISEVITRPRPQQAPQFPK